MESVMVMVMVMVAEEIVFMDCMDLSMYIEFRIAGLRSLSSA
jgi:hypothetical protein